MFSRLSAGAAFAAGAFALGISVFAAASLIPATVSAGSDCTCFKAATIAADCASMDKRRIVNEPFNTMSGSRALYCGAEGKGEFTYIAVQQGDAKYTCAYYTPKINNPRESLDKEGYDACLAEIESAKPGLGIQ